MGFGQKLVGGTSKTPLDLGTHLSKGDLVGCWHWFRSVTVRTSTPSLAGVGGEFVIHRGMWTWKLFKNLK